MDILDKIETARLSGVWLEIATVGFGKSALNPKPAEGYTAKARWAGGRTLIHVGYSLEEAVNLALEDASTRQAMAATTPEGEAPQRSAVASDESAR